MFFFIYLHYIVIYVHVEHQSVIIEINMLSLEKIKYFLSNQKVWEKYYNNVHLHKAENVYLDRINIKFSWLPKVEKQYLSSP